uniref:Uncharacterized protein n=1 Tax=Oryza barthii TaxID=65489 RepID=A0A0D3GFB7_9ORYZ
MFRRWIGWVKRGEREYSAWGIRFYLQFQRIGDVCDEFRSSINDAGIRASGIFPPVTTIDLTGVGPDLRRDEGNTEAGSWRCRGGIRSSFILVRARAGVWRERGGTSWARARREAAQGWREAA